MQVCDHNHAPICHDSPVCPLCEVMEENSHFDEMMREIEEISEKVEQLKDELAKKDELLSVAMRRKSWPHVVLTETSKPR